MKALVLLLTSTGIAFSLFTIYLLAMTDFDAEPVATRTVLLFAAFLNGHNLGRCCFCFYEVFKR